MQKNWDKWKSILKINDVTTFLLCILHKFKKYKKKGCISHVNVRLYKSIESINLEVYNIHLEDITDEDIRPG